MEFQNFERETGMEGVLQRHSEWGLQYSCESIYEMAQCRNAVERLRHLFIPRIEIAQYVVLCALVNHIIFIKNDIYCVH